LPVGVFLDHGPSVEAGGKYPDPYSAAFAKAEHRVVQPGDAIPIKGLEVSVVASAGKSIEGKGDPNPHCSGITPHPAEEDAGEDAQSVGIVVQFGKFRFADLADLTWNRQLTLLCPENRIGKVDLLLTPRHGGDAPQAIWGMAPKVSIMNNGA